MSQSHTNRQGAMRQHPDRASPRARPESVAREHTAQLNAAERWTELYAANRHVITHPQALLPGITLVVP